MATIRREVSGYHHMAVEFPYGTERRISAQEADEMGEEMTVNTAIETLAIQGVAGPELERALAEKLNRSMGATAMLGTNHQGNVVVVSLDVGDLLMGQAESAAVAASLKVAANHGIDFPHGRPEYRILPHNLRQRD